MSSQAIWQAMHPTWRLSHARGYLALGLNELALEELSALPDELSSGEEAMALRIAALNALEQWVLLQPVAAEMSRKHPDEAAWWVTWAYAARRAESLGAAEAILREAELRHPNEATIQFNLGCYACQRGDLAEARRRVDRAIALDGIFRASALTDRDLAPLRAAGYEPPPV